MLDGRLRVTLAGIVFIMIVGLGVNYCVNIYLEVFAAYQAHTGRIAHNLELYIAGRTKALQVLAANKDVRSLDPQLARPELIKVSGLLSCLNMSLFSADGVFITSIDLNHPHYVTDMDSFRVALNGQSAVSARIARVGIHNLFAGVRVPVYDGDNAVKAVLSAGIPSTELAKIIEMEKLSPNYEAVIVDANSEVIYHTRFDAAVRDENKMTKLYTAFFSRQSGCLTAESALDKKEKMYFFDSLSSANWRVAVAVPVIDVYIALLRETAMVLLVFLFVIALMVMLYTDTNNVYRYRKEIEMERLERLSAIDQMAAAIAHEIRNPLTSIKGFIQLIKKKADQAPPVNYMDIILEEIDRISRLIEEFRSLARPAAQPVQVIFDLGKNVEDVVALMTGQAHVKNANILLHVSGQLRVEGDPNQLKQVWINLIRNAIEAIAPGGMVSLTVAGSDGEAKISVADNGVGIHQDMMPNLGKPFFTTKENGTGLGLVVCFNIIRNHGGKIDVESSPGIGTTFTVSLPLVDL